MTDSKENNTVLNIPLRFHVNDTPGIALPFSTDLPPIQETIQIDNIPATNRTPSKWKVDGALQEAVDKYIQEDPARYRAAQQFGDFLTSHPQFSNLDTFKIDQRDIAGEELMYLEVCKIMRYHGVKPKELEPEELILVKNKLGDSWRNELMETYNFEADDF